MRTLNDVLPWLLDTMPWLRDFQFHQWKETMIVWENSRCKLCHQPIEAGEIAMGAKGSGILHLETCFEQCCQWAVIRDNALIALQQRIYNYYKQVK